jgi:hypothetical protein
MIHPPISISDKDVQEFKDLYKKHFDIDLSDIDARQKCSLLVRQMQIIYRPITKEQVEALEAKDKLNDQNDTDA